MKLGMSLVAGVSFAGRGGKHSSSFGAIGLEELVGFTDEWC